MPNRVYIIDGCRTPFIKFAGAPGPFAAADLAVGAGRALLARQSFSADNFDEVILGCVAPAADEANIARVVSLRLGCGEATPAWTVARNCASGLQALDCAAANIAAGRSDLILAGGTESMSHVPLLFSRQFTAWLANWTRAANWGDKLKTLLTLRPSAFVPVIGLLKGLTDPVVGASMGQTAEQVAHDFDIDRKAMDEYAVRSHERLATAIDGGVFDEKIAEIVPLFDSAATAHQTDNGLRRDSDVKKLAKLKPVFDRPAGRVTAGNSAQLTDGCALLVLASEAAVAKYNLQVRGEIIDCHWAGLDPNRMGLGPVHAATPLMQRHALDMKSIDYWEINEAFAAQVLACLAAWKSADYCRAQLNLPAAFGAISPDRLNLDGGGISIGHPVGASGARIVLHALHVLERKNWTRAIATLCIGGGQGGAMLIERRDAIAAKSNAAKSSDKSSGKSTANPSGAN